MTNKWACENCEFTTKWTAEDHAERGNPVCPNCDEDLVLVNEDQVRSRQPIENGIKLVGHVGVDSGQVIITDPCYLKGWQDNEFTDKKYLVDKKTGTEYRIRVNFENYDSIIRDGKTMNELIRDGEIEEKLDKSRLSRDYSYEGACDTTCYNEDQAGEIGIGEQGVVASSGFGDGEYPVYAEYSEGRIKALRIVFF